MLVVMGSHKGAALPALALLDGETQQCIGSLALGCSGSSVVGGDVVLYGVSRVLLGFRRTSCFSLPSVVLGCPPSEAVWCPPSVLLCPASSVMDTL